MSNSKTLRKAFFLIALTAILVHTNAFAQTQASPPLHKLVYKNTKGAKKLKRYNLRKSFNEYEHITLPTEKEIFLEGYTFGGWFDNEGYSGEAITEIPIGTVDNVTLHAMWIEYETEKIAPKVTALTSDGKVHISWETSSEADYTDAFVYIVDGGIRRKIGKAEKRTSSVYGKYSYFCYEDKNTDFDGMKFELHAAKKKKVENEAVKVVVEEVTARKTNLPIVNIDTENLLEISTKAKKIPATINISNSKDLENPKPNAALTIKGRGTSSWGQMDKKSYTIKLAKKSKLLGMKKNKSWAVIANHSDKTLLRNNIAYEIGREIFTNMAWNPSTKNIHLYLNGCYLGVYMLCETVKIDGKRVDVPNIKNCNDIKKAEDYGFLLEVKLENRWTDNDFNFKTAKGVAFTLSDPDGADISAELRKKIRETTQKAENALFSEDFANVNSKNYFGKYFDIDSFIDWWLVNEIARNTDAAFCYSCFVYFCPADQKLHMGPLWDFDIGFGNVNYNNFDKTDGFRAKKADWITRMFESPEFVEKAKARWNEKYPVIYEYFTSDVQNQFAALSPDADTNFSRWRILGAYVWPNADGYKKRKTYESECDYLNNWIFKRLEWLDENINKL